MNTNSTTTTMMHMLVFLTIFSSLQHLPVFSFEYQVGGNEGWTVPPLNDTNIYNAWASHNRFLVGDTIRFKYRKDSVMEVSKEEYKKCKSSHPSFFSNTGDTIYKLDHPGAFYFISGVSGHCDKGEKMIIKVIYPDDDDNKNNPSSGAKKKSAAASPSAMLPLGVFGVALFQLVLS